MESSKLAFRDDFLSAGWEYGTGVTVLYSLVLRIQIRFSEFSKLSPVYVQPFIPGTPVPQVLDSPRGGTVHGTR